MWFWAVENLECSHHASVDRDQGLRRPAGSFTNTVKDLFNSIEIKYFGGDCSVLLEFSQFLNKL